MDGVTGGTVFALIGVLLGTVGALVGQHLATRVEVNAIGSSARTESALSAKKPSWASWLPRNESS
ncbi:MULTISPECIES: hypothetical protein [Streptomyces]|uniref:hypothetical protein n=1 Tax=Streptomyces TaxID=1883 RepID=UPI000A8AB821|nr:MULTISPECIES: hypothetical protein [Streptomyces]